MDIYWFKDVFEKSKSCEIKRKIKKKNLLIVAVMCLQYDGLNSFQ